MKTRYLLIPAIGGMLTLHASAATLVDWDFSGIIDANQPAATTVVAGGTLLTSTLGNAATGLSTTHLTGEGTLQYSGGNEADGEHNLKQWDGSGTTADNNPADGVNDGWMQFTLTADAGNTISLTGLSISSWRNGAAAPPFLQFFVNVDGGGLTKFGSTITENDSGLGTLFETYSFTDMITGASEIEIRFAPVGSSTQRGDGNLHINGLTVTGSVAPIPEPSSMALVTLALGGIFLRRRR